VYGKDIRLAVSIPDFALRDDSISLLVHSIGAAAGASIQLTVLRCCFSICHAAQASGRPLPPKDVLAMDSSAVMVAGFLRNAKRVRNIYSALLSMESITGFALTI